MSTNPVFQSILHLTDVHRTRQNAKGRPVYKVGPESSLTTTLSSILHHPGKLHVFATGNCSALHAAASQVQAVICCVDDWYMFCTEQTLSFVFYYCNRKTVKKKQHPEQCRDPCFSLVLKDLYGLVSDLFTENGRFEDNATDFTACLHLCMKHWEHTAVNTCMCMKNHVL